MVVSKGFCKEKEKEMMTFGICLAAISFYGGLCVTGLLLQSWANKEKASGMIFIAALFWACFAAFQGLFFP